MGNKRGKKNHICHMVKIISCHGNRLKLEQKRYESCFLFVKLLSLHLYAQNIGDGEQSMIAKVCTF
jgi:hypothetical protein